MLKLKSGGLAGGLRLAGCAPTKSSSANRSSRPSVGSEGTAEGMDKTAVGTVETAVGSVVLTSVVVADVLVVSGSVMLVVELVGVVPKQMYPFRFISSLIKYLKNYAS